MKLLSCRRVGFDAVPLLATCFTDTYQLDYISWLQAQKKPCALQGFRFLLSSEVASLLLAMSC
jgi:hypothetical protein